MRKIWFIIAAVVFLGVVCGVMILNKKSHYSPDAVIAEMAAHGNFLEDTGSGCSFDGSVGVGYRNVFQKVVEWYYVYRANYKMTTSECLYSKSGSDYYSVITFYEKNNRIYEVEIEPERGAKQDALDLQSTLSKAFPDLPCKISDSIN